MGAACAGETVHHMAFSEERAVTRDDWVAVLGDKYPW